MTPGRFEREAIRQFESGGEEAFSQHMLHAGRGYGGILERGGEHRTRGRCGNQAQRDFSDEAEQTFRADKNSNEIKTAFVLLRASPHAYKRAVGQGDLKAEDVVTRYAILQTAGPPGVCGDVAAQRTFFEAGWIGRIKETESPGLRLKFSGNDARLDDSYAVDRVDLEYAIHPREGDDDSATLRHASADVAASRAATGNGNAFLIGKAQQHGDIFGLARKDDGLR